MNLHFHFPNHKRVRIAACFSLIVFSSTLHAAVPTSPINPDLIRGVKWTPVAEAQTGILDFDTAGIRPDRFLSLLHTKGINSIVLKVEEPTHQIPATVGNEARRITVRNAAIVTALKALKNAPDEWHVFLWRRAWLQRNGKDISDKEFESDMSGLINVLKSNGCDDIVEGIMPIETNIGDSASVLRIAVQTAHGINKATKNWLQKKTFLFPGAGMGAWFRGIDRSWGNVTLSRGITKKRSFFDNIADETRYFSFVVKNMPSHSTKSCVLGNYNTSFKENGTTYKGWEELGSENNPGFATDAEAESQRRKFLNEIMGFRDLVQLVKNSGHPSHAHVIYWGDANEGMTGNKRSEYFHQTWHQLMVKEQSMKGYFSYYPLLDERPNVIDDFDRRKFLFRIQDRNGVPSLQPRGRGWTNWQGWPQPSYSIVPNNSSN